MNPRFDRKTQSVAHQHCKYGRKAYKSPFRRWLVGRTVLVQTKVLKKIVPPFRKWQNKMQQIQRMVKWGLVLQTESERSGNLYQKSKRLVSSRLSCVNKEIKTLREFNTQSSGPKPADQLIPGREITQGILVVTPLAFWACDWSILPVEALLRA